ncbi:MAG: hypothetical protein BMS9Abin02_1684 [Anaerolineae bacterium]|nr:MAG: hypothetical protein BMS9Abin02_1684 [Anaerolineae bacterium]
MVGPNSIDDSFSVDIGVTGDIVVEKIKEVGVPPAALDSGGEAAGAEFWQLAKARINGTKIKQATLDIIDVEPARDDMGESLTKL